MLTILALALQTSITIAWMCMCIKKKSCNFHTSLPVKGKKLDDKISELIALKAGTTVPYPGHSRTHVMKMMSI